MKKLLFALVFVPMVCFGEIEYLNELPLSDEQIKKFEERFKAEQNNGFDPSKPYTVIEDSESGPWDEYRKNNNTNKEITYEDMYRVTEEYVENIPDESKDKIGIIKKDELIALINELSLKLELMVNAGENKELYPDKKTFELIKKYPYSSHCNQKLITISSIATTIAYNSRSPHGKDLLYILEKLTSHSLGLSEIYDAAIYHYVESVNNNGNLVKK